MNVIKKYIFMYFRISRRVLSFDISNTLLKYVKVYGNILFKGTTPNDVLKGGVRGL